jgi:hypothetical protein
MDGSGNLVIADTGNKRVRVAAAATGTFYGQPMTAGDIYTVAGTGASRFSGDGGPATAAELDPQGVAVDRAGNAVIADITNFRVRVVAARTGTFYRQPMTAGDVYTVAGNGTRGFAGDGGPAAQAELSYPDAVAVDRAGNLVIADASNFRVRVVAARAGTFYGQPMTAGDIYTVAGDGVPGYTGNGGPATAAEMEGPAGVAVDGTGNLLIADEQNQRVRVVPVRTGTYYGQAMTADHIYTVAGNGKSNFFGDGGPATRAHLRYPQSVSVDAAGNLLIADSEHQRIRVVAAKAGTFYGQAMTAGYIYTVAGKGLGFSGDGGPATSAKLNDPVGVAVDGAGNLVIADLVNQRIRVVAVGSGTFYGRAMTAGDIYTVAGNGKAGYAGDGRRGTSAQLCGPSGVAVTGAGALLIADECNYRVRQVTG